MKDASSNWPSSGLFSPPPISGRTALGDRVIQSLKPRTAHLSANRLPFFSSPVTGNPCNDSGRHRICRSAVSATRAIHQSVAPHPPPAFPPTALRLTKYYVAAPENTISRMYTISSSPARRRACPSFPVHVRTYIRREARHRSSIDPKRIRGKRARRWINTKTSVTHDQAEPSSAISSCFALAQTSPCAAVAFFFHVHVHATVYACECACIFFILVPVFSFSSPLSYPAHNALYATPI